MIRLSIEESESIILPQGVIYPSETEIRYIEDIEDTPKLPAKMRYNDDNEMEFTLGKKKFIARDRLLSDTCENNCLAKPHCLALRCTPFMLRQHNKAIIFDKVVNIK